MAVLVMRIIPTRVGTRADRRYSGNRHEDHPHACGDKSFLLLQSTVILGSSPRVWGQDVDNRNFIVCKRIIPTRVGTRCRNTGFSHREQDHPHACGDKTKEIKENSGFAKSTA